MLAPVRTIAPAITPVSLAEVKASLHVDHSDDDAMIGALLMAATEHFDGWTGILGRCLVEQTWRQDFDDFRSCLRLPLSPVISIESVKYTDTSGAEQTVDAADYVLRCDGSGPYVEFTGGYSFPPLNAASAAVRVEYIAGYATTPAVPADPGPERPAQSTVPEPIKLAIILQVKLSYDPLEPAARESYQRAIDALVAPFRRVGV